MRLDHLLSKELASRVPGGCPVPGRARGWNVGGEDTLLGPEGSGPRSGVGFLVRARLSGPPLVWGGGSGWGFRPLLENCTVDASIKFLCL